MSQSGLNFSLNSTFGNTQRLLVYYDFSGMSGRHIGNELDGSLNYAVIENCEPANDTGLYSGVVVGVGGTIAAAKLFATGTFLDNDKANLTSSNIKITGASGIPLSNSSALIDFEFNKSVNDCILFGSLEKTSDTINDQVITGAKGYNVGITDRGKLFYQGFDKRGDFIKTIDSVELSKRNIISFSIGSNNLSFARLDYLNNSIQSETFDIDTSFIAPNGKFFLGGSEQYFRTTSGEQPTSGISLNSFCLLSGYIPPSAMLTLGSGLIGNYFTGIGAAATFKEQVTGYKQTIVYQTGVTGYDYQGTGSINISTGRYMRTGNFFGASSVNTGEGDRYFIYRSFDNALSDSGIKSFVKEEVGYLHPNSGYQYLPTGDSSAFDTLGLRGVDGAVTEYAEQIGISGAGTVAVQLYASRMLTGITSGISGILQEPLAETIIDRPATLNSGIRMNVNAINFKKDYIYYLGERL
jgi:hypothetical protein